MEADAVGQDIAQAVEDCFYGRLLDHRAGHIEQSSISASAQRCPRAAFFGHADHTSMARTKRPCGAISASPHVLITRDICSLSIRGCHHSVYGCCDSSSCFSIARTRSSEERVLSTATLRTMLPFNPVSPACFDPLAVMR